MKAYILHNVNDLRYEDVKLPECPSGWAVVKVRAAGICSSDIARIFTKGTYHFPTIPGHEFSGVVVSVGDKDKENLIGKNVGVFPLIPCRNCPQCAEKHYEMCSNYNYLGSRCDGGFAEFVTVPIWNLILLPDSITFETAAMLEPLSVALHAVKQSKVKKGDNVAIVGTGMIGISAGQWAYRLGAQSVTVIGRSEQKRELVERCGLPYNVCIRSKDANADYDVVIEAVGSSSAINLAINLVRPGGTLLLMGNPSGDIQLTQNTYWRILRKQLELVGSWNSSYDGQDSSDWTEAINAISNNEIQVTSLISHTFNQDELMKGLTIMREHKISYCKIMTTWNIQ